MSQRLDTERLAELIDKKCEVLSHLRDLSRRQVELIAQGDMTKLLRLLAAKQQQLDQLQTVEQGLDPFRQDDPDQRLWHSAADRQRCRQVAEKCETLLKEIFVVERQCEADLAHRRDQVASQLQAAHSATEARSAYAPKAEPAPQAIDFTSQS